MMDRRQKLIEIFEDTQRFYADNADALNTAEKIEPLVPKVEDKYIRETERLLRHIEKTEGDKE